MTKKIKKNLLPVEPKNEAFERLLNGLIYISETDAEIVSFVGAKSDEVTAEELRRQTGTAVDVTVETVDAGQFFDRLTTIKDWFGDREKDLAQRFSVLKDELMARLTDVKVFRIGRIRVDIYIVGLDADGRLGGVKTKAVET